MANVAEAAPVKAGPPMVIQLAVLLVLTLAAAGIGYVSGGILESDAAKTTAGEATAGPAKAEAASSGHGESSGGHGEASSGHGEASGEASGEHGDAPAGDPLVVALPALTTNLAAPSDVWIRIELDVLLDKPSTDPHLAEAIHQDLLAYIRTVKLHQIEGASGFQHLKNDLQERASIRSGGLAKMVLIKTLIFE